MSLVGNFLDFLVKKQTLGVFDYLFVLFPILDMPRQPVLFKISVTVHIPLTLGMLGDVDDFQILSPCSFHIISKRLNNIFKRIYI